MKHLLSIGILAALFFAHSVSAKISLTGDISNVDEFPGKGLICGALDHQKDGRTVELVLGNGGDTGPGKKFLMGKVIVRDRNQEVLWMSHDWTVLVDRYTSTIVAGNIAMGGYDVMPQVYLVMRNSKIRGLDLTGTISFDQKPISLGGVPYPNAFCMIKK